MNRRTLLTLSFALPCSAQFGKLLEKLGVKPADSTTSDNKLVAGLKEALSVGATNAIKLTSLTDGYFKNELIKILLPEKLKAVDKALHMLGMGKLVDDFVLSMNRAAEAAAPLAGNIFTTAITSMTFDDARKIFTGGETSATDFFKVKTRDPLTTAFRPVIEKSMEENQTTRNFEALLNNAKKIPFFKTDFTDIQGYVTGKALDGLFLMVGEEEKKIRKDPAARVTSLLKEVFGGGK